VKTGVVLEVLEPPAQVDEDRGMVARWTARPERRAHAAAVRRSPSVSVVFGLHNPSRAAFDASTHERPISPGRSGARMIPGGGPRTFAIAAMSSLTLVATPVPMLYVPRHRPANELVTASATSSTYT
jgi:hypothetical protein